MKASCGCGDHCRARLHVQQPDAGAIPQRGTNCTLGTAEPHNGEEKGVACWELREKGDKQSANRQEGSKAPGPTKTNRKGPTPCPHPPASCP